MLDNVALLPKSVIIIEYLGTLFFLLSYRFAIKMYYVSQLKNKGIKMVPKNMLTYLFKNLFCNK